MTNLQDIIKEACVDKHTLDTIRLLVNGSFIRVVNYHNTDPVDE